MAISTIDNNGVNLGQLGNRNLIINGAMNNMFINSAQYVNILNTVSHITATIDGTEMSVPLDPANRHYAEILRQVEAGTLTIADAE